MPLKDITVESVLEAIIEFHRLDRDRFLANHHFQDEKQYVLVYPSRKINNKDEHCDYPSKAIASVAHKYLPNSPGPLPSNDPNQLSGGIKHRNGAAKKLLELGFQIKDTKKNALLKKYPRY